MRYIGLLLNSVYCCYSYYSLLYFRLHNYVS